MDLTKTGFLVAYRDNPTAEELISREGAKSAQLNHSLLWVLSDLAGKMTEKLISREGAKGAKFGYKKSWSGWGLGVLSDLAGK
jgi:hypothetical protein